MLRKDERLESVFLRGNSGSFTVLCTSLGFHILFRLWLQVFNAKSDCTNVLGVFPALKVQLASGTDSDFQLAVSAVLQILV